MYDKLAESYDLMISWKDRLKREKPFFNRIFRKYGVKRILDTACGTGIHAMAFHDWGYHVVGSDVSAGMIEKARENAGDRQIAFVQAGFTELDKTNGLFDAVTCLGNSLPHVLSDEMLEDSLASMFDALIPGGVLVVHGNSYDRILGRQERFMPPASRKFKGSEYVFIRFFDFRGETMTFNVITLKKESDKWTMSAESSAHRALTCELLTEKVRQAGFEEIEVYGSFANGGQPFDPLDSDNLILTAQKPHNMITKPPSENIRAIDRIPIKDNGESLLDLLKAAPEIESRVGPIYGRATVIEMLKKAQAQLPEGCKLKVKIIHRSLEHQRELYETFYRQLSEKFPHWRESRLRRETNKFLAPPDAKHPPGHTTGGAVDLTIVGPNGEELDMTSTIDPELGTMETMATYSKGVTPRAAKNRQMLVNAMSAAGFSNYPGEWWHWSYGDSAWAVRTGAKKAIYGAAPPPEE